MRGTIQIEENSWIMSSVNLMESITLKMSFLGGWKEKAPTSGVKKK